MTTYIPPAIIGDPAESELFINATLAAADGDLAKSRGIMEYVVQERQRRFERGQALSEYQAEPDTPNSTSVIE